MNLPKLLTLLLIALATCIGSLHAQDPQFPIVDGFGGIYEIPGSHQPDTELHYRIVVDLKSPPQSSNQVNPGLNNVARMMNLHGLGGVEPEKLSVVVVAHGGATQAILSNRGYQQLHGIANPNIPLIKALTEAGAEIYVCGQSLISREFAQEEVNPSVKIGLSMLTVVTEHMHNGYELLVFD